MDVTKQLRLLPSPNVMLFVQGRPATLSAEQLIAEIEWPDTAEAQVKKAHGDEDSTVAEKANFAGSMTCELLRRTEAPAQATPATHRCRSSFRVANSRHVPPQVDPRRRATLPAAEAAGLLHLGDRPARLARGRPGQLISTSDLMKIGSANNTRLPTS